MALSDNGLKFTAENGGGKINLFLGDYKLDKADIEILSQNWVLIENVKTGDCFLLYSSTLCDDALKGCFLTLAAICEEDTANELLNFLETKLDYNHTFLDCDELIDALRLYVTPLKVSV